MEGEGSPYKDGKNISYEEFLWAFNTASSRHITLHGHLAEEDPELKLIQMPLLDMLNHSLEPNVGIFPYHDKMDNRSFLAVRALKDIGPDEHLTVSYGSLSNIHLAQKYGFTIHDQAVQEDRNVVQGGYSFGEYQSIVYEEQRMKEEISNEMLIPYNTDNLQSIGWYPNRFDQLMLRRLRLAFLTSQTIIDYGGTERLKKEVDFNDYFDQFNESCSVQFLIDSVEKDLRDNLKPREVYEQQLKELQDVGQVDSIHKVNLLNVLRLQINEHDILKKNLDYLMKLRKDI